MGVGFEQQKHFVSVGQTHDSVRKDIAIRKKFRRIGYAGVCVS
jgi:hypothetical protein